MFMEEVDREKYPNVTQKMRFELVQQLVDVVTAPVMNKTDAEVVQTVEEKAEAAVEPVADT